MIQEAMPVPPRLRGLAPARWVGERGRPVPTTAFIGSRLELRTGVGLWDAAYFSPDQTSAWRNYAVSLRVRGLGRADSGANATLMLRASARPRDPRVAVTLAAGRVTLQRVGASGSVPIASTVVDERSVHQLDVTVAGDMAAISVERPHRPSPHRPLEHPRRHRPGCVARPHGQPPARLLRPRGGPGMTGHRPDTPHAPQEESS